MKVCIIGGGLTGLSAGMRLSEKADVTILEKNNDIGGLLASYTINDAYYLEKYYHHCFTSDTALLHLLSELSLSDQLEWRHTTTGYMVDGKIYPLTTPFEILRYPYLSLIEKAKLAHFTMKAKKIAAESLDSITARDYITDTLGEGIYRSFFEPLLHAKFGEMADRIAASWVVSRVSIRSDRSFAGERLGYLKGGFVTLIEGLTRACQKNGCRIYPDCAAESIEKTDRGWLINGVFYHCVLSTIPPQALVAIGGPEIMPVPYQGAACMALGLSRDVTQGIYWVNIRDPAPYGAVIGHTNFIPRERYGEDIVYLAAYRSDSNFLGLEEMMIHDFCNRFAISRKDIFWHRLTTDPYAGPLYLTGYHEKMQEYQKDCLFMAGMFSPENYPERSMEGSIRAGERIARTIQNEART
ncbi:MAG: FAD-dependent oxidoreductase [Methanospirillaceae archaeon]|nr:FAD-dependent oxidoreductase [Methanospirillaceae archaeon]